MKSNNPETTKGRIDSFLFKAIVFGFAFFHGSNIVPNDGIPKTYAFSPSNWIKNRAITRESGGSKRRSLVPLCETRTIASPNSTESNIRKGNLPVRSIMSILEERYDSDFDPTRKTREWKKTRNYLYNAIRSNNEDDETDFEQQVVTVLDFLDDRLELPPGVSRRILQESPRILRKPVDSFLIPTSDFLLQLWGRDLFVQAVERNPALLLSSGVGYTKNRKSKGAIAESVEEIIVQHTRLSSSAIQRIKGTAPFVFGLEASKVHSVLDFLGSVLHQNNKNGTSTTEEELQQRKILGKVILAHPYLLNLCVESNLKPRLQFLAETCDLTPTQVAKVVQTSNGSVLSLSVEQNLKPTLEFLWEEIFCQGENSDPRTLLKKCVLTHPQLLGLSLTNLKSKVQYFDSIGSSLAVRVARKCPAIYSLNLEQNIVPTIDFLSRVWGVKANKKKKTNEDFASMLQEYPNIITLSVESNLQPTMMFFNKTGYTLLNENWELVQSSDSSTKPIARIRGRYIAASLYNRLLPRWHFCLSEKADQLSPPLHLLVMASDEAFCMAMNVRPESFARFKKEAIPRLKFSSQFDTWLKTGKPIDL